MLVLPFELDDAFSTRPRRHIWTATRKAEQTVTRELRDLSLDVDDPDAIVVERPVTELRRFE